MKNLIKICAITLALILVIACFTGCSNTEPVIPTSEASEVSSEIVSEVSSDTEEKDQIIILKNDLEDYLNEVEYQLYQQQEENSDLNWYIDQVMYGINQCQNEREVKNSLATQVSNQDFTFEVLDIVAKKCGYAGYTQMVRDLLDLGFVIYIPEYAHPEYGVIEDRISCNTTYELSEEYEIINN